MVVANRISRCRDRRVDRDGQPEIGALVGADERGAVHHLRDALQALRDLDVIDDSINGGKCAEHALGAHSATDTHGGILLGVTLGLFCFAPGHAGSFDVLTLPATSTRQIMVPAAIAIFFTARTRAGWAVLAAIFGAIALSHPTYAIFLLIPLLALARWEWRN